MKKNEIKELLNKPEAELKELLRELRDDIAKIHMEQNIGKIKNVSMIGEKKKQIARILTFFNNKELSKV